MYLDYVSVKVPTMEMFREATRPIYQKLVELAELHDVHIVEEHVVMFLDELGELNPIPEYDWSARRFVDEYQDVVHKLLENLGWDTRTLYVYYMAIYIFARELCGSDPQFDSFSSAVENVAMHRMMYA